MFICIGAGNVNDLRYLKIIVLFYSRIFCIFCVNICALLGVMFARHIFYEAYICKYSMVLYKRMYYVHVFK